MQIVCAKNDCNSELQITEALWSPGAPEQLLRVSEMQQELSNSQSNCSVEKLCQSTCYELV